MGGLGVKGCIKHMRVLLKSGLGDLTVFNMFWFPWLLSEEETRRAGI